MIKQLSVQNLRAFKQVDTEFVAGVNLLVGASGAGKSSILESLHLLSTGHSHRSRQYKSIVSSGAESLHCLGRFEIEGVGRSVGFSRTTRGNWELRLDRTSQSRLSVLAGLFPFRVIGADSWRIVSGEPELRRNLMDWFLFHVEQHRYPLMRYRRTLAQRNALLQAVEHDRLLDAVDAELATLGETITAFRQAMVKAMVSPLISSPEVTVELKLGFKGDLFSALKESRLVDRKLRTTTKGPHRGDLVLGCFGRPAKEVLSQGQLARAALALQLEIVAMMKNDNVAIGIDDIHAYLDADSLASVLDKLKGYQVFLTETNSSAPKLALVADRVFHVKHGQIETAK